jgi:hypothetical protein
MRRMAGTLLMALAVLCAAGTVLLAGATIVEMWRTRPTADTHVVAFAGFLLSGALFALETAVFLTGRYLRQPHPGETAKAALHRHGRWLPLTVYLGTSIGMGFLAEAFLVKPPAVRLLAFLISQPAFFFQLLLGGVLGLQVGSEAMGQALLVTSDMLYFLVFFYPFYSLIVMDRKVEIVRCQRMKTIAILFGAVHLLIGLAFATMMRA